MNLYTIENRIGELSPPMRLRNRYTGADLVLVELEADRLQPASAFLAGLPMPHLVVDEGDGSPGVLLEGLVPLAFDEVVGGLDQALNLPKNEPPAEPATHTLAANGTTVTMAPAWGPGMAKPEEPAKPQRKRGTNLSKRGKAKVEPMPEPATVEPVASPVPMNSTLRIVAPVQALKAALAVAKRCVSGRATLPILHHVLLTADANTLTLEATDLELSVAVPVEGALVERGGSTTLPVKLLEQTLKPFGRGGTLELEADEQDHVQVRHGSAVVTLHGLPATEFPVRPSIEPRHTVRVDAQALRNGIERTRFAVSDDETRARLTGLLLKSEPHRLRLVATDTHRLATETVPAEHDGAEHEAIVPGGTLATWCKSLGKRVDGSVTLHFTETQVRIEDPGGAVWISRLIEGEFPNYRKVIPDPANMGIRLHLRRAAAVAALESLVTVARENCHKVVLTVVAGTDDHEAGVVAEATSAKTGSASAPVPAGIAKFEPFRIVWEGTNRRRVPLDPSEPFLIGLNIDYALDALKATDADTLILDLDAANQPVLFLEPDRDWTSVLMPMQLF